MVVPTRCTSSVFLWAACSEGQVERQRGTNTAATGEKSLLVVAKGCYQCRGGGRSGQELGSHNRYLLEIKGTMFCVHVCFCSWLFPQGEERSIIYFSHQKCLPCTLLELSSIHAHSSPVSPSETCPWCPRVTVVPRMSAGTSTSCTAVWASLTRHPHPTQPSSLGWWAASLCRDYSSSKVTLCEVSL